MALATEDEIATALGKQGVTNIKRISIRKGEQRIQTNTYILTFDKPQTPKEVKIGYCLERVEQYVPAPLKFFKCQEFGHHREACRGRQTCSKCGEKELDHAEEDCLKEIIVQTANKIIQLTQELVLEARRIVGSYKGESSYASVARRVDRTNDNTKCRTLVGKLIKLEANDRPKFQEHLKKTTLGWILPNKLRMGRDPMLWFKQKHM